MKNTFCSALLLLLQFFFPLYKILEILHAHKELGRDGQVVKNNQTKKKNITHTNNN